MFNQTPSKPDDDLESPDVKRTRQAEDDLEEKHSRFHGVTFQKLNRSNPWQLSSSLLPYRLSFKSEEEAADKLISLVETHLKQGKTLPLSLQKCEKDADGRYLRAKTFAQSLDLMTGSTDSPFHGVSLNMGNKTLPWNLTCQPLTPQNGINFATPEEAAMTLTKLVTEHCSGDSELPRSLKGCQQDEQGRYLKKHKVGKDEAMLLTLATPLYQGVTLNLAHKSTPWRLNCKPFTPKEGLFFVSQEEAADALVQLIEQELDEDLALPPSLTGCQKDSNGRYLRKKEEEKASDEESAQHTSPYQGISFKPSNTQNPWRLRCVPVIPLDRYFPTEAEAADTLKKKVKAYLDAGNELPRSLKGCQQDETGRYLRINKSERNLKLLLEPTHSVYQGVSFNILRKLTPWMLICYPLTPKKGLLFATEEEAANKLKALVAESSDLPSSLQRCKKDEQGRFLREKMDSAIECLLEPKTSLFQGVTFVLANKINPWKIHCKPLTAQFGEYFPTEEGAVCELTKRISAHLAAGLKLPRSLIGCSKDDQGRYLRVDKAQRNEALQQGPTTSIFQGVSFDRDHKSSPWRLGCQPLISLGARRFLTQEDAALELTKLVKEHLDKGLKLPRSLKDCQQDDQGRYLRKNAPAKTIPEELDNADETPVPMDDRPLFASDVATEGALPKPGLAASFAPIETSEKMSSASAQNRYKFFVDQVTGERALDQAPLCPPKTPFD